ncbi:MAG: transcriptional regulator [Gammaproteobacteria bacterium]|jgi:nitrogen regulatory protein PII|nr:transcriptional regulator [Gammaproteobacteria bacterium]NBX40872.1 transcriptional regulator [Gammaproteobacteria bacterium]
MTGAAHTLRKLVTVITEATLERDLTREIETLGVAGYTVTDARGRGAHGERPSHWGHSSNIRLEVICDTPLAERLVERLRDKYYPNFAIVMWVQDVEVLRPDKFR